MAKDKAKKKRGFFGRLFRFIGTLLLLVVVLLAALVGWLTFAEYKPADRETVAVEGTASRSLKTGDSFTIVTWNVGYGSLGDNADYFLDGGKSVNTADKARTEENLRSIMRDLNDFAPVDFVFFQEIDLDATRSNHINELEWMADAIEDWPNDYAHAFANNFKVAFLPYPVPPIGKVDAGIATFASYKVSSAERIQLPCPFSWPVRTINLKRCLLVTRVPLADSDKELVLVNLHLEAYDSGEGKIAQTKMLAEILNAEQAKGNYVIAGGDFNQIFSSADTAKYPAQEGKWQAGEIDVTQIAGDWQFMMDARVPSCRSLDQPYVGADKSTFQYYLIDGFIVSGNIKVNTLQTMDEGFVATDHNPVRMNVTLTK